MPSAGALGPSGRQGQPEAEHRPLSSAIARDSYFARAHAGLGQAYWQRYQKTRDGQWADKALLETTGALRLVLGLARGRPIRLRVPITEAAEARDAGALLKHLATDFQGQGGLRRAEAGAELKRYFFAYEKIGLSLA